MASLDGEPYDWNLGRSGREYPEDVASNESEPDYFPFVETEIRRRRGRGWIGLGVFLVILIVILVALDNGARWYLGSVIANKARSSLSLADSTPVTVKIGGASVLYQAATGRFQRVDVTIASLGVGALSGKATLTATGVPLSLSKPSNSVRVMFTASPDELKKLLAGSTPLPVTSVKIASGAVQVGTTVSALGITVPIAIAFVPSAVDGELALTPKSLVVNGATVTPDGLRATLGGLADSVLATQKICVAKYLPKQLPLESVRVNGASLELAVAGKSVTLNSGILATKGVCA